MNSKDPKSRKSDASDKKRKKSSEDRLQDEEEFILELDDCEDLTLEEDKELFGDLDEALDEEGFLLEHEFDPPQQPEIPKGASPIVGANIHDDVVDLHNDEFLDRQDEIERMESLTSDGDTTSTEEIDGYLATGGLADSEEDEFHAAASFHPEGGDWEGNETFDPDILGMRPLVEEPEEEASPTEESLPEESLPEESLPETDDDELAESHEDVQEQDADDILMSGELADEGTDEFASAEGDPHFGRPSTEDLAGKWSDPGAFGAEESEEPESQAGPQAEWKGASAGPPADAEDDEEYVLADAEDGTHDEIDPIYGATDKESAADTYEYAERRSQSGSHAALGEIVQEYADTDESPYVVTAPRRKTLLKRFVWMTMTAAVLLVWGVIAAIKLRPDLPQVQWVMTKLNLQPSGLAQSLEVARVDRPVVSTQLELPHIVVVTPRHGGNDPTTTDPGTRDPVAPAWGSRRPKLAAGLAKLPKLGRDLLFEGRAGGKLGRFLTALRGERPAAPRIARVPVQPRIKPVVPDFDPTTVNPDKGPVEAPVKGPKPKRGFESYPGVVRGGNALAQLKNGNFFVGRVLKLKHDTLIIGLDGGEVSFVPKDVQKVVPLADTEFRILNRSPSGYVKLKNSNKLWGKILENLPDVVTIQTGSSRIVIPRTTVLEVATNETESALSIQQKENWRITPKELDSSTPIPTVEPDGPETPQIRVRLEWPAQEPGKKPAKAPIKPGR